MQVSWQSPIRWLSTGQSQAMADGLIIDGDNLFRIFDAAGTAPKRSRFDFHPSIQ